MSSSKSISKDIKNQLKIISSKINLLNKQLRSEKLEQKETIKLYKKQQNDKISINNSIKSLEKELLLHSKSKEKDLELIKYLEEKIYNMKLNSKENDNLELAEKINNKFHEKKIIEIQKEILNLSEEKLRLEVEISYQ